MTKYLTFWPVFKLFCLILGLSTGLTVLAYTTDQNRSDRWIPSADQVALVTIERPGTQGDRLTGKLPYAMGPALSRSSQDISGMARLLSWQFPVEVEDRTELIDIAFVDEGFFDVIRLENIQSDYASGINTFDKAIVTRSFAENWFGGSDVIGQTFDINHQSGLKRYTVQTVLETFPANSHLKKYDIFVRANPADFTASFYLFKALNNTDFKTYIRVAPGSDMDAVSGNLKAVGTEFHRRDGGDRIFSDPKDQFQFIKLDRLYNINKRRPVSGVDYGLQNQTSVFALIGLFALLIGSLNYALLTMVEIQRSRETIGVKKLLGEPTLMTVRPIYTTTAIYISLAVAVSLLLVNPLGRALFETSSTVSSLISSWYSGVTVLAIMVTAIFVAASIPAFVALRVTPEAALGGVKASRAKENSVKYGLVFVQLCAAAGLLFLTVMFLAQVNHLENRPIGFERDNLVAMDDIENDAAWLDGLELRVATALPGSMSARANVRPGTRVQGYPGLYQFQTGSRVSGFSQGVDLDFFETIGATRLAGRFFNPDRDYAGEGSDGQTVNVVINKTMSLSLGFSDAQTAIGARIRKLPHRPEAASRFPARDEIIVGVVDDVQFQGRNKEVLSMSYVAGGYPAALFIKLENRDDIAVLRHEVRDYADIPVRVDFISTIFKDLYVEERRFGERVLVGALIAGALAMLGVFGLINQIASESAWKLGIHRLLGARGWQIFGLLTLPIILVSIIASLLGFLAALIYWTTWVEQFAAVSRLPGAEVVSLFVLLISLISLCGIYSTWHISRGEISVQQKAE